MVKDTSPDMEAEYRAMLLSRPGAERLAMASSMFDSVREMAERSIINAFPHIDRRELRRRLFYRIYRDDFPPEEAERILGSILGEILEE